jgi:hypothetical protein
MFITTNEAGQDDIPTCTSLAYDSINSPHLETHCSKSPRIFACIDSGSMFLKALASLANSNASRIASSSVWTLQSRWTCRSKAWRQGVKKRVGVPYPPTRQGDAPRGSLRADPMLTSRIGSAEEPKLAQQKIRKHDISHTSAIGPTVSITCLTRPTALFHVFMVPITSSARRRVASDISVWLSATRGTGVPLLVARSLIWDKGVCVAVAAMGCMVSSLA